MKKNDIEFPFIKIDSKDLHFEKGYGKGGNKIEDGGINAIQFKNKLSSVLSIQDIETKFMGKFFFEIDLRVDYYKPAPQELFQRLGVEVLNTIPTENGVRKVIVSGDKDTINKYKDQKRINKEYLKCIDDIKIIESSKKIGDTLKQRLNQHQKTKVNISFIKTLSTEEITEIEKNIPEIKDKIKYGKFTSSAIGTLNKDAVEKLSKIPLIKSISIPPKWGISGLARVSSFNATNISINTPDNITDLPPICIIDTGVSEKLNSICEYDSIENITNKYDTTGHGTSVASLCLFDKLELSYSDVLTPLTRVISYKISDESENEELNFMEELITGIDKLKDKTNIFCLSWNSFSFFDEEYEDQIVALDNYLQKNNILLVNSAGNLNNDEVYSLYQNYPNYVFENPVLSPSEAKYVLSVGSTTNRSENNIQISSFSRTYLPPSAINKVEDRHIRIKPEVFAEGGFMEWNRGKLPVEQQLFCLDHQCKKGLSRGTSLSAPQIAKGCALLKKEYNIQNVETLKSLIFLKSTLFTQMIDDTSKFQGRTLYDEKILLDSDDGFYLFFEDNLIASERVADISKDKVFGKEWEFPIFNEIDSIEIAISHSNSCNNETLRLFNTRIVTKVFKPKCKNPLNKNYMDGYGTMGKYAPLVFGKYTYSTRSTPEGFWKLQAYIETARILRPELETLGVRVGIAIKLNVNKDKLDKKKEIYRKLVVTLGKELKEEDLTFVTQDGIVSQQEISQTTH